MREFYPGGSIGYIMSTQKRKIRPINHNQQKCMIRFHLNFRVSCASCLVDLHLWGETSAQLQKDWPILAGQTDEWRV